MASVSWPATTASSAGSGSAQLYRKVLVRWRGELNNTARMAHPGVGSFGHSCWWYVRTGNRHEGGGLHPIPRWRRNGGRPDRWACRPEHLVSRGVVRAGEGGQAQRLRRVRPYPVCRPAGAAAREAGYPRLDLPYWQALFAPAGTPRPIIERLNTALREALAQPKVREALARSGIEPYPELKQTPEATMALLRSEIKRWSELALPAPTTSPSNNDAHRSWSTIIAELNCAWVTFARLPSRARISGCGRTPGPTPRCNQLRA